jgi:hypothetical protein
VADDVGVAGALPVVAGLPRPMPGQRIDPATLERVHALPTGPQGHVAGMNVLARPLPDTSPLQEPTGCEEAQSLVFGWWAHRGRIGVDHYIRGVLVQALNALDNSVIDESLTDAEGQWRVCVPTGARIYIVHASWSPTAAVYDLGGELHRVASDPFVVLPGKINRGLVYSGPETTMARAIWVLDDLREAWAYVTKNSGGAGNLEGYSARFSQAIEDSWYSATEHALFIGNADDGVWCQETVLALTGMAVLDEVAGGWLAADCRTLDPQVDQFPTGVACSWVRGWSLYFKSAVRELPFYTYCGSGVFDVENRQSSWGPVPSGSGVTWNVAAALWDLHDRPEDGADRVADGFARHWRVVRSDQIADVFGFWRGWMDSGGSEAATRSIMIQNRIASIGELSQHIFLPTASTE